MWRRRLAASFAALIIIVLLPAAAMADTGTSVSLTFVNPAVQYNDTVGLEATVSPADAPGSVEFEASYDDAASWSSLGSGDRDAYGHAYLAWKERGGIGPRSIRATFHATGAYSTSVSDVVAQYVDKGDPKLSSLSSYNPNGVIVMPHTAPVVFEVGIQNPLPIQLQEFVAGNWVTRASSTPEGASTVLTFELGPFDLGDHQFRAYFPGDAHFKQAELPSPVRVMQGTVVPKTDLGFTTIAEKGKAMSFHVGATYPTDLFTPTGQLVVRDLTTDTIVAQGPVTGFQAQPVFDTVGSLVLGVSYAGDEDFQAGTSEPYNIVVQEDAVHASNVTQNYSTFYPTKDGYRDTLRISGRRDEPASAVIRILIQEQVVEVEDIRHRRRVVWLLLEWSRCVGSDPAVGEVSGRADTQGR